MVNIPYGGAKGGVVCDPWKMSPGDLQRLTRRYIYSILSMIGPDSDISAPDVNTNPQVMSWILDTYSMIKGHTELGVVTGKPLEVGGSVGRIEATGRGVFICLQEQLRREGKRYSENISIAIQGFGNVGSNFAGTAHENDCRILGITDAFGGVYDPDGLDIPRLIDYSSKHPQRSIEGYPGVETITNKELFELDVDVLAPCALENQITLENADDIEASMILEGANGPTTPTVDEILLEKGVVIVPDILANAGGVTVSYFEWVQGLQYFFWDEEQVNKALRDILVRAFSDVNMAREKFKTKDLSTAAMALAVERVAKAIELRGIFP